MSHWGAILQSLRLCGYVRGAARPFELSHRMHERFRSPRVRHVTVPRRKLALARRPRGHTETAMTREPFFECPAETVLLQ